MCYHNINQKTKKASTHPHASSVSVALDTFLYQICNDETVDAGLFIYNKLLRHIGTFGVKIPIPLPRFFSSLLIHLNSNILTLNDASRPIFKTLALRYRHFQGSHVHDIEHDIRPSRNTREFDFEDVNFAIGGFNLSRELVSCVINTLTVESRALSTSTNILSERRLEVDNLVCHLKSLLSSTNSTDQESE